MKTFPLAVFGLSLLLHSALGGAEPREVPLWLNGAPGSEARKDEPVKVNGGSVSNIHYPTLTIYLPPTDQATGAGVIVCPGGGHRNLVMKKEGTDVAEWLASHGIAAFVLKNRLARDDANPADKPQPYTIDRDELADAQRALRLVRSRAAEWGVRPEAVGIMGFSAGGEVAALAAMHPDSGKADAPDPLDRLAARPAFQCLVYPGQSQRIQPAAGAPPAFLCCGVEDRPDISEGVPKAYLLFKTAKVPVEMHIYAGVGHGFALRSSPASGWAEAFRVWLVNLKFITAPTP